MQFDYAKGGGFAGKYAVQQTKSAPIDPFAKATGVPDFEAINKSQKKKKWNQQI